MKDDLQQAIDNVESARPASGFRPETEAEWAVLQSAIMKLTIVMYRGMGLSEAEAERIGRQLYGGKLGRSILNAIYSERSDG